MKTYKISLFSKGNEYLGSITVEHDGRIGAEFKEHYLRFAKMFINARTETIEVN